MLVWRATQNSFFACSARLFFRLCFSLLLFFRCITRAYVLLFSFTITNGSCMAEESLWTENSKKLNFVERDSEISRKGNSQKNNKTFYEIQPCHKIMAFEASFVSFAVDRSSIVSAEKFSFIPCARLYNLREAPDSTAINLWTSN